MFTLISTRHKSIVMYRHANPPLLFEIVNLNHNGSFIVQSTFLYFYVTVFLLPLFFYPLSTILFGALCHKNIILQIYTPTYPQSDTVTTYTHIWNSTQQCKSHFCQLFQWFPRDPLLKQSRSLTNQKNNISGFRNITVSNHCPISLNHCTSSQQLTNFQINPVSTPISFRWYSRADIVLQKQNHHFRWYSRKERRSIAFFFLLQ